MKRFISTVAVCTSLLILLSYFLFPVTSAAENPILVLLNLPAPPPPNPEVSLPTPYTYRERSFSKGNPPPDDAPIDVLMEYWRVQAEDYNEIRHRVHPSEKVLERIFDELEKDPTKLNDYLRILPRTRKATDFVKETYDRLSGGDEGQRDFRRQLKGWLKFNSPHFSAELARDAALVSDTEGYVTHHRELVALARVDWDRAGPIVSRLYNNPTAKASRTAALWALYLHAIDSDSPSDTDRYRDELKETVSDKSLPPGIRDLALDALSLEKEWSGRDEWYLTLMEDETLLELGGYTGLTTLILSSPDDKYIDRMIALLESAKIGVRTAAARNLMTKLGTDRPDVIKALLPWLTNPKWLKPGTPGREMVMQALTRIKIPESVPSLIAALDEKGEVRPYASANSNANAAFAAARRAMIAAAAAANAAANSAAVAVNMSSIEPSYYSGDPFPLRQSAIAALSFQEDPRAVPALRRLLSEVDQPHLSAAVVSAIYNCGGYSISEQVDAIEYVARNADELEFNTSGNAANLAANAMAAAANGGYVASNFVFRSPGYTIYEKDGRPSTDVKSLLGSYLAQMETVKDELARGVVDRILSLDRNDVKTAIALRKIVLRWDSPAVNALLLADLKNNRTEPDALIRLLSVRQTLRETQQSEIFDIRTGGPIAVGISACLLEDANDFQAILDGADDTAKTAMLACARLIRAQLPVPKVAGNLNSKDKLLALAAERYLESEDSPEARRIVLSLHPDKAKIMGATTAFFVNDGQGGLPSPGLRSLFATVAPFFALAGDFYETGVSDYGEIEQELQAELKKDPNLLGVYSWMDDYVRVYKDKAVLSWHDDPARFRERSLTKDEFDNFKGLLSHYKAEDMPPFLECVHCSSRQFLMVGRNGGRRLYLRSTTVPPFFAELDRMFADLHTQPATIKYWARKDVPGLEVLFADDRLDAMAVWKNGADFRLLTADKIRRAEIDREIEAAAESFEEELDETSDLAEPNSVDAERAKRQFENYAWSNFRAGVLDPTAAQPAEVSYVPVKDGLDVATSQERWKARSGSVEIRSDETGLYKLVAGKLTRIKTGFYSDPVVTTNGRWVIVTKFDEAEGNKLVRVNLLTNREYAVVPTEDIEVHRAYAFLPSINRVLVGLNRSDYGYDTDESEDTTDDGSGYFLLDPETGRLIPARGEIRPLIQQTYRPLQNAPAPFEFWAAIPKEKETVVGIYSTRTFTLRPVLTLPRISFDSMAIWVDASEARVYFVYRGHLLAAPLKTGR